MVDLLHYGHPSCFPPSSHPPQRRRKGRQRHHRRKPGKRSCCYLDEEFPLIVFPPLLCEDVSNSSSSYSSADSYASLSNNIEMSGDEGAVTSQSPPTHDDSYLTTSHSPHTPRPTIRRVSLAAHEDEDEDDDEEFFSRRRHHRGLVRSIATPFDLFKMDTSPQWIQHQIIVDEDCIDSINEGTIALAIG